jgi:hypothetical protein
MYRVDAVVNREAYADIVQANVPKKIDSPYFTLFYSVILSAASFMDKANLDGTVNFIFDKQGKIGQRALDYFHFVKEYAPANIQRRLGAEPIFENDSDWLPLKAADVRAWEIRRHLDIEQPEGTEHNSIMDSILAMSGVSCQVRPEDLQAFVENIDHGLMLRSKCLHWIRSGESLPE